MKTSVFKRVMALVLGAIMLAAVLPFSVIAAGSVTNYSDFLAKFKQLEEYALAYENQSRYDSGELMLNFVRTGVERYRGGNWDTLAGVEITAFTTFVEEQDAANGTSVMDLRDIVTNDFKLPNGNPADFGHMFGTMNISYITTSNKTADLSGWAGDICDLLDYCVRVGNVPAGSIDEMTAYILEHCFGVDASDAYGWDDFYGDMDGYYFVTEYNAGKGSFSELMEEYYTADLDDSDRAAYFLNSRFPGKFSREDVRNAVFDTYRTNVGLQVLEADRGLGNYADLRKAACFAFADYLFSKADGRLNSGVGGGDQGGTNGPANGLFTVFDSSSSILAPGVKQEIEYAITADGKQMVYYLATVDVTRDDLTIMANYNKNDPSKGWAMQRVEDQVNAMVNNHKHIANFKPIVAINGDGFNTVTGEPGGLLVMEGIEWHSVDHDGFFAILADGTAMIGSQAEYAAYKDQIQEAIGGFGAILVKDGVVIPKGDSTRASRTAIGIKADGSVVMMVMDGRQEPFSCGGTMAEIAQVMYEAGCVNAVNLDGGGSTTFLAKPEGADKIQLVNRPSDGYARSVSTSLVAVSTAVPSEAFERAIISSDYDYLTIGSELKLFAKGVNNIGSSAVVPTEAIWSVSDSTIGSVSADGTFVAKANGEVIVNLMLGDKVVGSKKLTVVVPDTIGLEDGKMIAVFDELTPIPLKAYYNDNPVLFNVDDVLLVPVIYVGGEDEYEVLDESAAEIIGLNFIGKGEKGIRNIYIGYQLVANEEIFGFDLVNMYRKDEAVFDFDNVTAGNRTLAWTRNVTNAITFDGMTYSIEDVEAPISVDYTFALDMKSIEIPERLADIVYMLPGSDTGTQTAFDYLLQLAERVCVLTEVKIIVQFDKNFDVDISNLKIVNDYFALKSASVDKNNVLTMACNWIDQTQPIDPATANPNCIMTGIKVTTKEDAKWIDNEIVVMNVGNVSYDIYLRASSLYAFAQDLEYQQKFGLYPYVTDETGWEGGEERGAHFASTYADLEDSFILENAPRQGWFYLDSQYLYYVNGIALTGTHYLPSIENPEIKRFYKFDENGTLVSPATGIVEVDGDRYYSINGEMQTGWLSSYDENGNPVDYYFDPETGKGVTGVQTIAGYTYTFTDYILTRGDLVRDANGVRYRWAGHWVHGQWFQVDGNWYCVKKGYGKPGDYYALTGYVQIFTRDAVDPSKGWQWHLFDENGVFQEHFTGIYENNGRYPYLKNGINDSTAGLIYYNGYYYYISPSSGNAIVNQTKWIEKTKGMIPRGNYSFDEQGRMINPPAVVKNGIYNENGGFFYYVNDMKMTDLGALKLTDDSNKVYYIYILPDGKLATGKFVPTKCNGLVESVEIDWGLEGKYYPPAIYTVTINDGTSTITQSVVEGNKAEKPADPAKVGYAFLGWYCGETKFDFASAITADITLTAKWQINKFTVSFDGTNVVVEYGTAVEKPADPIKEGYTFLGWYNGDVAFDFTTAITSNVVLNAKWEINKYVVSFAASELPGVVVEHGGKVAKPADPTRNGYTFLGWYVGEAEFDFDTAITADISLTAKWEKLPEVKNGIYKEGNLYFYYVNDAKQYDLGVVKMTDEAGKVYYIYVRSSGQLATGKYWPSKCNGLIDSKSIDWGTDGKYYGEGKPSVPSGTKNGIYKEGNLYYYYVNNAKQYNLGVVKMTDEAGKVYYIYVRSSGQLATGKYWPSKCNGLIDSKSIDWGTDGKYYPEV